MTPRQVDQVQASFAKVVAIADRAAALFYDRLFETAPEVRALFRGNMHLQGQKLMAALRTVVNNLAKSRKSSLWRAISRSVISLMASSSSITRSSGRPCCGHWNKGWATNSPLPYLRHGRQPTPPYRRP